MKTLKEIDISGKRVFVRADLNVPLAEDGTISDDHRIKQFLPTLRYILEKGGKAIISSHLGRPVDRNDRSASLSAVGQRLSEMLGQTVPLAPDSVGAEVEDLVSSIPFGSAALLENLRYHAGERENNRGFAEQLARLGDVYVNDAFGTAHREHASIVLVPQLMKERAAGLLLEQELSYLERALVNPKPPLTIVIGGMKASTKIHALLNIAHKVQTLIIGGAIANTFLAAQGIQMGRSLYEPELFSKVFEIMATVARREGRIYLPVDFRVGPSPGAKRYARSVTSLEVPPDMMALDIGPATSILFKEALHSAETIIWNGPMGAFENQDYAHGTTDMIEHLASAHGLTIAGGGDTHVAIKAMELSHKFDYISTGGGAFLGILEGRTLPGVKALL